MLEQVSGSGRMVATAGCEARGGMHIGSGVAGPIPDRAWLTYLLVAGGGKYRAAGSVWTECLLGLRWGKGARANSGGNCHDGQLQVVGEGRTAECRYPRLPTRFHRLEARIAATNLPHWLQQGLKSACEPSTRFCAGLQTQSTRTRS